MSQLLRSLGAPAALAIALVTTSLAPARAGELDLSTGECTLNSDGSGGCEGSFTGFREHADPTARAMFVQKLGYAWFYATSHKVSMMCTPSDEVHALWPLAMALRTSFAIEWDKNGVCTGLWLYNDSSGARY
jgi:hypothetical protein